jgi:hypothetical protein
MTRSQSNRPAWLKFGHEEFRTEAAGASASHTKGCYNRNGGDQS